MELVSTKKTLDGRDLFPITIGGKTIYATMEKDASGNDVMVEYDEKILNISYSQETEEGVQRIEIKKQLYNISKDRILGFHEYKYPDSDQVLKVIVVWSRKKGDWSMTIKKGVSDLNNEDIVILTKGLHEIKWVS